MAGVVRIRDREMYAGVQIVDHAHTLGNYDCLQLSFVCVLDDKHRFASV